MIDSCCSALVINFASVMYFAPTYAKFMTLTHLICNLENFYLTLFNLVLHYVYTVRFPSVFISKHFKKSAKRPVNNSIMRKFCIGLLIFPIDREYLETRQQKNIVQNRVAERIRLSIEQGL